MNKNTTWLLPALTLAACSVELDTSEDGTDNDNPGNQIAALVLQENSYGFCGIDGLIENNHNGYSGDGFANVENKVGSQITYEIVAQTDGDYDVKIAYAGASDRPAKISSNGKDVDLTFASSSAWDIWSTETANISLKAGLNEIVLISSTAEGMPNIDSLTIMGDGLTVGTCMYTPPVVVEPQPQDDLQIFVVGDSTVADYGASKYPMMGWGQVLQFFFEADEIAVENRARGGRSTKSYKVDGIWDDVLAEVGDGDYVLIQFGHNDRDWTKTERYTTEAEYETYLTEYVNETRAKNATPILVSPMVMNAWRDGALRNVFTESGNNYAGTMAKVASDLDVAFVDLNQKSWDLVNALGVEQASYYLYLILNAGEYANYPDGSNDGTHFQESGAVEMARMVVEDLESLNSRDKLQPLLDAIKPRYKFTVNQQGGGGSSIITSSAQYPEGTPLTVKTISPDTFDAWYGAGSIVSDSNLYQTNMPAGNFTLTAAFNGVVPTVDFSAATVFLIGDSTVANYADGYYPQTGWGQVFQSYLDDAKITVDNRALGGRSSKSFYNDHWDDVKANIQSGDFVFIQFGINDRAADDARKAPTGGTDEGFFEYYMTNFVTETRDLGATPVFVTTVRRNQWQNGEPYDAYHEHPVVTRTLASDLTVPLIDLNAKNKALLQLVGEDYANEFYYMGFGADQYGNATAPSDTVHFQKQGAVEMARLVAEGVEELSAVDAMAPIVAALKPSYTMSVSSPTPDAGTFSTAFAYPAGVPFTLKALANTGGEFTQWLDENNAEVSTEYLYEFDTTDMDTSFKAVFNNSEGLGQQMTNLQTKLDGTNVVLTWSLENFGDQVSYVEIYRNTVAEINTDRVRIAAGVNATGTFVDDTAEAGTTYWYMFKVVAGDQTINTSPEGEIRKPFENEVPVTNLATQIVNGTSIEVSWDLKYFDPAVSYLEVHRNDVEEILGRSRIVGGAPLAGTTVDENLEPGKTYWYMFKIIQDGVTTNTSPAMPITIPADAVYIPPATIDGPVTDPSTPVVTNLTTSLNADNQVVVTWDLANVQDGTVVELYRNSVNQLGGRGRLISGADMTGSFVDDTAVSGTTYWYMFKLIKDLKTHNTDPEAQITIP